MKYIPNIGPVAEEMLKEMGLKNIDELLAQIPESVRNRKTIPHLPAPQSELEIRQRFKNLASQNSTQPNRVFCGGGIYAHDIPSAIDAISGRAEFLTSYTPYQPEISQGTLISIYEFQTMVSRLFEMEVTNASMYDGSTAFAEALLMAKRLRPSASKIYFSNGVHPEIIDTARTSLEGMDVEWIEIPLSSTGHTSLVPTVLPNDLSDVLTIAVQTPNFLGIVEDLEKIRSAWSGNTVNKTAADYPLFIVHTGDPHAFALVNSPGAAGADIVTAEGQPLGCYPAYGGPAVGLFSTRANFVRQMPGRLVGKTKDAEGRESFCLTLSTREQHIRREKATSNICTNQGWCALRVAMYLSMRGPQGLVEVAQQAHAKAAYLAEKLSTQSGVTVLFGEGFFNEFVVRADRLNERIVACLKSGIVPGIRLNEYPGRFRGVPSLEGKSVNDSLLVCVSELMTRSDLDNYLSAFSLSGRS